MPHAVSNSLDLQPCFSIYSLRTKRETGATSLTSPYWQNVVLLAVDWTRQQTSLQNLPVGVFGASTGGGAALAAAAASPHIRAVVSRGGRPDLAGSALPHVHVPSLLIVGGNDREVLALNEAAAARMTCEHRISVVPDAGHLFEEPGTLDQGPGLVRRMVLEASGARRAGNDPPADGGPGGSRHAPRPGPVSTRLRRPRSSTPCLAAACRLPDRSRTP
jgi:dienelactone hydrolase